MSKLLILGGTNFIGRRLVEQLIDDPECELTLFNRGKTNHALFPTCRKLTGDRQCAQDLDQLFLESWDYVVDLSCYFPDSLRTIVNRINSDITKYIFISTCSVYDMDAWKGMLRDEIAPLLQCSESDEKSTSLDTYGKRKAACESYLAASNLPYIIFRPALVYGPYDTTDRLYYWIHATQANQAFILPEKGERRFSITYVDDLVTCIIQAIKNSVSNKIYNCISHPSTSISEIVTTSAAILQRESTTVAMDADFLKSEHIAEWFDLPLWLNTDEFTFSNTALRRDFDFEPMDFTSSMENTINYYDEKGFPIPSCGLDRRQQNKLTQKYRANG